MMSTRFVATAAVMVLSARAVFADCPVTQQETKEILRAFPAAQSAERAGRAKEALGLYVKAQGYLCDGNPNAAEAAQRAAHLAPALARAAERKGALDEAFDLYEQGGDYAAADRVLVARLRQQPDDEALVARALSHFDTRALPSFAENHAHQIAAAGRYAVDAALRAEVAAMPAKAIERAMAREAASFDERYLAERVRLVQSRPEPTPGALDRMQSAMAAEQAFRQKYPVDLLKQAQNELRLARRWAGLVPDGDAVVAQVEARTLAQAEARAAILANRYAGAPEFLAAAADYYRSVDHLKPAAPRVARLTQQAATLGDEARARGRYELAIAYYDVAGLTDRAEGARALQRQAVMQQVQPDLEAARTAAEALAAQFGDPATIEAMKEQAQAARAAAAATAKDRPVTREKETADLERELGLR